MGPCHGMSTLLSPRLLNMCDLRVPEGEARAFLSTGHLSGKPVHLTTRMRWALSQPAQPTWVGVFLACNG